MVNEVLVVDDDAVFVAALVAILQDAGLTVRVAYTADDALSAIEQRAPDLVLVDVVMPGTDGMELLEELAERHTVKTMGMSSMANVSTATRASGAVAHMSKQLMRHSVADEVRAAL